MKLGNLLRVENIKGRSGKEVVNQFIIYTDKGIIFQSYDKIICCNMNGRVYLDEKYYNFSQTTSKYRNLFLNEKTTETEKKIKRMVYYLANLNNNWE